MDHERASETELLVACRKGDERAAVALYERVGPLMRAVARVTLRDHHLAEDAVQRALCRVVRSPVREIMKVKDARAWMVRIVRNESASLARTLGRARARHERLAGWRGVGGGGSGGVVGGSVGDVGAGSGGGERWARLSAAIEGLPVELREVVYLRHVAGLSFDQIEESTGINRNTASSRHRQAVRLLRGAMESSGDGGAAEPTMGLSAVPAVGLSALREASHVR